MRRATVWLLLLAGVVSAESIEALGYRWTVPNASDWKISPGMLELVVKHEPKPGVPRRPWHFAVADTTDFTEVTLEVEVKRYGKSLMLVFAWQDEAHFDYVHLSVDDPTKQPVHNGVFHVFGGERVRISYQEPGPGVLPTADWHRVKVTWSGKTGQLRTWVDGKPAKALEAWDLSLRKGKVGLGSFDETGAFRNLRIRGK